MAKLVAALQAVFSKMATEISLEELYRAVESMCLHKFGAKLYVKLSTECQSYIEIKINSLATQSTNCDPTSLLGLVEVTWRDHCEHMNKIRNIFGYLDQKYAIPTQGILSIWDMGTVMFRKYLEEKSDVKVKMIVGLLTAIESERSGLQVDREVLRRVLRMLVSLGLQVYRDNFETPFLIDSKRFFTNEGQHLTSQGGM